ncbi:MAG TPA: response regulator transcription factor [Marmoricola sp.]|nr:response regulator transcription factor [Marmoricola sp.]
MTPDASDLRRDPRRLCVAIVDDHRLLVDALALALESRGVEAVVPELGPLEGLAAFLVESRPDLVLLDLDLGRVGNGSDLVRPLVEAGLRVLMVTAATDVEQVARAVEQGAVGVARKDGSFTELVRSVIDAAEGREVMTPRERVRLVDEGRRCQERELAALTPFGHLTPRECEVLRQLTQGRAVAEIARRSVVSEATVRSQVRAVLTKLGVRSQLEAVVAAQHAGWH